jgi:hypothetical protein
VRVDWAIPCRYVETTPSGATIVGAGADLFGILQVPAAVPVLFAVRFVGSPDELDGTASHPIICRIYDPDGEQRGEQRVDFGGTATMLVADFAAQIVIPIGIVLDVQRFATYSVEFEIDGTTPVRVPIHMVQATAPEQAP